MPDTPLHPAHEEEARLCWGYRPYMRCWVAYVPGEATPRTLLKPTAHTANRLARAGATVYELKGRRGPKP